MIVSVLTINTSPHNVEVRAQHTNIGFEWMCSTAVLRNHNVNSIDVFARGHLIDDRVEESRLIKGRVVERRFMQCNRGKDGLLDFKASCRVESSIKPLGLCLRLRPRAL